MAGRLAIAVLALLAVAACGTGASSPPSGQPSTGPSQSPPATRSASPSTEPSVGPGASPTLRIVEYPVTSGSHPHDVAPAVDGGVWYTGQHNETLGHLDPTTGTVREIDLGDGARPHGVIVGPDGAPWITDGGLNAIVRVDPATERVEAFELPADRPDANLNTASFDGEGILWFTGQGGVFGWLDPSSGSMEVFDAPRGRGPYGIATTPRGDAWYSSLAGSYIARLERGRAEPIVVEPPTDGAGARRVWSDSTGRLWVAEWNAGQVGLYDPAADTWREWRLPGDDPQAYAVYVDDQDIVWLTDFGANAIVRFEPMTETFTPLELPSADAAVRQLLGRPGEVWGAESAVDKLVVVQTSGP